MSILTYLKEMLGMNKQQGGILVEETTTQPVPQTTLPVKESPKAKKETSSKPKTEAKPKAESVGEIKSKAKKSTPKK